MGSRFQTAFNSWARPKLVAEYGETVELRDAESGQASDLTVRWVRADDEKSETEGIGVMGLDGEAMCWVSMADLPNLPGPRSTLLRNEELWEIRHAERWDETTWRFRLGKPREDNRISVGSV